MTHGDAVKQLSAEMGRSALDGLILVMGLLWRMREEGVSPAMLESVCRNALRLQLGLTADQESMLARLVTGYAEMIRVLPFDGVALDATQAKAEA